jgi:hypothetical protein
MKFVIERVDLDRNAGIEQVKGVYLNFERLREATQSKLDQLAFDIDRRVKHSDMKQNFEKLNDILEIKFKQLEDTK